MVGRCISYWNGPFLGDMLIFRGVSIPHQKMLISTGVLRSQQVASSKALVFCTAFQLLSTNLSRWMCEVEVVVPQETEQQNSANGNPPVNAKFRCFNGYAQGTIRVQVNQRRRFLWFWWWLRLIITNIASDLAGKYWNTHHALRLIIPFSRCHWLLPDGFKTSMTEKTYFRRFGISSGRQWMLFLVSNEINPRWVGRENHVRMWCSLQSWTWLMLRNRLGGWVGGRMLHTGWWQVATHTYVLKFYYIHMRISMPHFYSHIPNRY